ncbi:MAG: hypothetical protein M0035_03490, partial [Actinomycetota bacterium]|nr:hypothetical protein [Actinomycetota bacterium]
SFHCRNPYWECDWQGDADHVAAMNLMARIGDREISRFTHYTEMMALTEIRQSRSPKSAS